ncbi:hypothetical protein GH714_037295 [Hevea brasiliensis]|uniref:MULE transposase domain-containing protein n=1 Tax=Hevea brasiliensis TaxID=3981 RepID=A0A6A6KKZ1_HEVBR|nr:hypothetical protein GH714_037295 [Hevea brasiliensis]
MKRRPIGSQENVRSGGMDASMRFEHNETDSEYAYSDELLCVPDSDGEGNVRVNPRDPSDVVGRYGLVRHDPNWSLNGIIARVKANFSFTINPVKAWRAREFALKTINDDEVEQYSRLHDYKLELLRTSTGSTVKFKEEKGKFEGIYICLAALKEDFKDGCRPLICVDGCWLKWNYGGQLLTAFGIDPNDCISL